MKSPAFQKSLEIDLDPPNGIRANWNLFFEDTQKVLEMQPGESLIRLGDGELDVFHKDDDAKKSWAKRSPHFPWMYDKLIESIKKSTLIGVPSEKYIKASKKGWGRQQWNKKKALGKKLRDLIFPFGVRPSQLISSNLFVYDLSTVPIAIKDKNVLIINSSAQRLAEKFMNDKKFKDFYGIYPNEAIGIDMPEGTSFPYGVRKHGPELFYNNIMDEIAKIDKSTRDRIDCVLIGAGIIGKAISADLSLPRAVSLDVGCLLSLYAGRKDRGIFYPKGRLGWLFNYKH